MFNNQLAIVIEEAITAIEKSLINENGGEDKVFKRVNSAINEAIKSKLKAIVEEVLTVQVDDVLLDSSLKSERTGAIVTLTQPPLVRYCKSTPKIKQKKIKIDDTNLE